MTATDGPEAGARHAVWLSVTLNAKPMAPTTMAPPYVALIAIISELSPPLHVGLAPQLTIEAAVPHGRSNHGGRGDRGAWSESPKSHQEKWAQALFARALR